MSENTEKKTLTVVMPALNEEASIAQAVRSTLEAFDVFGIDGEIVAVNDGSQDGTQVLFEEKSLEFPGRLRIVRHEKPKGIGASFWEGVELARGDIVVMLPGDNENDPREALRYMRLLDHVDLVIPFIFNREARPFFRNLLSFVYRFIINTTFLVNFNYTNGTVLYRRSILKELDSHSDGFFFQTDILIRTVKKGYLFAEVPYRLGERKSGVSKAISFPSLWKVVCGYFRLVKDFYFRKGDKQSRIYSSDSLTAVRRKNGP